MKVENLLDSNSKETQRCLEVEQQRDEIKRETAKLQDVLDMVRVSSERQQLELQVRLFFDITSNLVILLILTETCALWIYIKREKSQLIDLVNTLRERNEKSSDARLKDIESENRKLIENNQASYSYWKYLSNEEDYLIKLSNFP